MAGTIVHGGSTSLVLEHCRARLRRAIDDEVGLCPGAVARPRSGSLEDSPRPRRPAVRTVYPRSAPRARGRGRCQPKTGGRPWGHHRAGHRASRWCCCAGRELRLEDTGYERRTSGVRPRDCKGCRRAGGNSWRPLVKARPGTNTKMANEAVSRGKPRVPWRSGGDRRHRIWSSFFEASSCQDGPRPTRPECRTCLGRHP